MKCLLLTQSATVETEITSAPAGKIEFVVQRVPAEMNLGDDPQWLGLIPEGEWYVIAVGNQLPADFANLVVEYGERNPHVPARTEVRFEGTENASLMNQGVGVSLHGLLCDMWQAGLLLLTSAALAEAAGTQQPLRPLLAGLRLGPYAKFPIAVFKPGSSETDDFPVLSPSCGRASRTQLELISTLGDWLPEEYPERETDFHALRAGVLLWLDELQRSHQISQVLERAGVTRSGDYWHAIMHRREQDFWNSKYWFRQVGQHPVFAGLAQVIQKTSHNKGADAVYGARLLDRQGAWNPEAFVDLCESCAAGSQEEDFARRVQALEMLLLLRHCLEGCRG